MTHTQYHLLPRLWMAHETIEKIHATASSQDSRIADVMRCAIANYLEPFSGEVLSQVQDRGQARLWAYTLENLGIFPNPKLPDERIYHSEGKFIPLTLPMHEYLGLLGLHDVYIQRHMPLLWQLLEASSAEEQTPRDEHSQRDFDCINPQALELRSGRVIAGFTTAAFDAL